MGDKCLKCGADLTKDAAFCPLCGEPKEAEPVQPQPVAQPEPVQQPVQSQPVAPQPKPVKTGPGGLQGLVDLAFSKLVIMLAVGIGVLLAWIGAILVTYSDYGVTGSFLATTGFTGMGLILLGGGFLNNKLDKYIRLGMILIGGYIIVTAILASTGVTGSIGNMFSGFPGFGS